MKSHFHRRVSCGCRSTLALSQEVNWVGRVSHNLRVITVDVNDSNYLICECRCGNKKRIRKANFKRTKSCGCVKPITPNRAGVLKFGTEKDIRNVLQLFYVDRVHRKEIISKVKISTSTLTKITLGQYANSSEYLKEYLYKRLQKQKPTSVYSTSYLEDAAWAYGVTYHDIADHIGVSRELVSRWGRTTGMVPKEYRDSVLSYLEKKKMKL